MPARVAVTVLFALNGALFSSLFARLPAIRSDVGLSEGELGAVLAAATIALILAQPLAGALVAACGSRPVAVVAACIYAAAVPLGAFASSGIALAAALAATGAANGVLDLSMNAQGVAVERRLGRPILGSLHAAFSFGALAGAGMAGAVASLGVAPEPHLVGAAAVGIVLALGARPALLPAAADAAPDGPRLARPSRALAGLGAIAFAVLLAEGAVTDWSAIYLTDELDAGEGTAAVGLAAFSLTMGVGRLASDRLVAALAPDRLARAGALLAAGGVAATLAAPVTAVALAGYTITGAGLAAIFPLALRAATTRGDAAPAAGIAAVSTAGYTGFVAGPPLIGFAAEAVGLRAAFGLVVVLCLAAAVLAAAVAPAERVG